ncbi:hypothetical protein AB4586_25830, partial [Vibrio sp. 10N.222.49.E4]
MKIPKTAFIFLLKCTGALFSVLTAILLSKYLGDDFLGKYSLSLTVIAVCAILASLGQHVVIMKNYVHRKKDSVNRTYASFFICLVTSIFIIPFLYYVLYRIDGQVAPIFLALFILLVLISLKTPVWTVNEKFFINSLVDDFIRPAITLIFAILLAVNIFFGGGIRTFSISMLLMVVTLTVVLFVAYHTIKLLDFKWEILCNVTLKSEVHSVVKSGYLVLFISLLQLMLNQFDRVFIANFNGYSDLGVYFKAQTIVYI